MGAFIDGSRGGEGMMLRVKHLHVFISHFTLPCCVHSRPSGRDLNEKTTLFCFL